MPKKTLKSGEEVEVSGIYQIIGARGAKTPERRTLVEGEPAPPTLKRGQKFKLVVKTDIN